ncbi:MAG: membrane protein insertase YidC [Mycoplasmataceae bacterium]|nr:membrane protein insertase YidC [Mycoplasmataceae bacterium]
MGLKPVFNVGKIGNNISTSSIPSPFWEGNVKKPNKAKVVFKQIWKWSKLLILIFFVVMGLWGCMQSVWDTDIKTSPYVGQGMEYGYAIGTTGDYRFDLMSNGALGYFSFDSFTWQYGPFYGLFVLPGAAFANEISWMGKSWWGGTNVLLAIFLLLLIIRTLSLFVSLRSTLQNEKMSEIQGKIAEINAKYKGLNDAFSRQRKSQEVMEIYKKNHVKPFAAFEQILITLPIFMIIYRVVSISRPMKATTLFNLWNFGATPMNQIFSNFSSGGWVYIFLLLIIIPFQFLSMKLPQHWAKKRNRNAQAVSNAGTKQAKRMKMIQLVMMCVMCGVVVFSATGVGVYWFLSALFSIAQSYIMHTVIIRNKRKGGTLESKLDKMLNV